MALGLGSLFNHSTLNQNVGWERDLVAQCITYRALRDIQAGEELSVILESRLPLLKQMLKLVSLLESFPLIDMLHGSMAMDENAALMLERHRCISYGRLWFVDTEAEPVNKDEEDGLEVLSKIETW